MKKTLFTLFCTIALLLSALPSDAASSAAHAREVTLPVQAYAPDALTLQGDSPAVGEGVRKHRMRRFLQEKLHLRPRAVEGDRKVHGLAIASFVCGLVGLFVAGITLGTLAVVFGIIANEKVKRNRDRYAGKGLAIAGLVLGLISFFGALIVLLSMA